MGVLGAVTDPLPDLDCLSGDPRPTNMSVGEEDELLPRFSGHVNTQKCFQGKGRRRKRDSFVHGEWGRRESPSVLNSCCWLWIVTIDRRREHKIFLASKVWVLRPDTKTVLGTTLDPCQHFYWFMAKSENNDRREFFIKPNRFISYYLIFFSY